MIVVAGEALIDRIVGPDGSTTDVPGGGPYNTARTIVRLGVPVAFLGCLSNDASGVALRAALAADGVDLSMAVPTPAPTTLAVAQLDADGAATYRFETERTSAPRLSVAAVRAALATRPAAFHLGTLGLVLEPMATALAEGLDSTEPGTLIMLDPNVRAAAIGDLGSYLERMVRVIRRVDVVKSSRDDLELLWPGMPAAVAAHRMLAAGPAAVVVTDGRNPAVCFTSGWSFHAAVPPLAVVDSVGAGDAFGGAFLARWIERGFGRAQLSDEGAMREAVELAVAVASVTCARAGADPPRRHEVAWPAS